MDALDEGCLGGASVMKVRRDRQLCADLLHEPPGLTGLVQGEIDEHVQVAVEAHGVCDIRTEDDEAAAMLTGVATQLSNDGIGGALASCRLSCLSFGQCRDRSQRQNPSADIVISPFDALVMNADALA